MPSSVSTVIIWTFVSNRAQRRSEDLKYSVKQASGEMKVSIIYLLS